MERREFLRTALILAGTAALKGLHVENTRADFSEGSAEFPNSLPEYLDQIKSERDSIEQKIFDYPGNPLRGIKELTKNQLLEDFWLYYPMYKAGEMTYSIPWSLLWIMHEHETVASRDTRTYGGRNEGAMQRDKYSWPSYQVDQAAKGWEFLQDLPQRYPADWKEIIWAAGYVKRFANQYRNLPEEEAILSAVRNNYSATVHGIARVNKYRELKDLLQS